MKKDSYTIFGNGFVGINLAKYLRKKKYKVFIPKKGKYFFSKNLNNIIYCIGNDNWSKNPIASYEANLGIVPKIIFKNKFESFTLLSSTRVYLANSKKDTNENSFIKVKTSSNSFLFNLLKLTAENLCLSISNKKIRVVRISNLFGDNFKKQIYLLPTLIRNSLLNKKIYIFINKKSSKDFLEVNEAFDVLNKILKYGKHRVYNVASGKNIKLFKIINKIKTITNCAVVYKNQKVMIKEPLIDISRIKNEFKFKPTNNLISSLDKIIHNYKKNL